MKTKRFLPRLGGLCTLVLGACFGTAQAQPRPDAGQLSREIAPTPAPPRPAPQVTPGVQGPNLVSPEGAPPAGQRSFDIRSVQITGHTVFSETELLALISDLPGPQRSLADAQQAAARIGQHYRQAGYLVARAYLPAQKMEGGALTIAVLEGRLGPPKIDNASNLSDARVQALLADVRTGDLAQREALDRPVLLLGDSPGVGRVDARLEAGEQVGETRLRLSLTLSPVLSGRIDADNLGSRYTGRGRLSATLQADSAFGQGERLDLRLTKSQADMAGFHFGASLPVGGDGLRLSVSIDQLNYGLGDAFKDLDALGRSRSVSLAARYPLLRSAGANVYAQLGTEDRALRDEVRSTDTLTDKNTRVANLGLAADWRDRLGGAGLNRLNLGLSSGRLGIDSESAAAIDAVAARTAGSYRKWNWGLQRQQALGTGLLLDASLSGQSASRNLDSSEKFSLGGPGGVRAYAGGEASGDEGWLARLELRLALSEAMSASLFHDRGAVSTNARPYLPGDNRQQRDGSGLGLQGVHPDGDWRLMLAWRGGVRATAEPDTRMRVWLSAGWRF